MGEISEADGRSIELARVAVVKIFRRCGIYVSGIGEVRKRRSELVDEFYW